jgi:hypothetical protein
LLFCRRTVPLEEFVVVEVETSGPRRPCKGEGSLSKGIRSVPSIIWNEIAITRATQTEKNPYVQHNLWPPRILRVHGFPYPQKLNNSISILTYCLIHPLVVSQNVRSSPFDAPPFVGLSTCLGNGVTYLTLEPGKRRRLNNHRRGYIT